MLLQFSQALEDAKNSVTLDPAFIKGYVRVAKCCLTLGDTASARQAIEKAESIDQGNTSVNQEKNNLNTLEKFKDDALVAYNAGDYRKVRSIF